MSFFSFFFFLFFSGFWFRQNQQVRRLWHWHWHCSLFAFGFWQMLPFRCHFAASTGKNSFRSAHLCSLSSCGAPPNPFAHIMRVNNVPHSLVPLRVCGTTNLLHVPVQAGVSCPLPLLSFPLLLLISAALISSPHQGHIARMRPFKSASDRGNPWKLFGHGTGALTDYSLCEFLCRTLKGKDTTIL